jgi:flagellar motor switch protein FliN
MTVDQHPLSGQHEQISDDAAVVRAGEDLWQRRPTRLRDVPLQITAQIGRTRLPIRAVLELRVGQVIELDRQVGTPIDIYANGEVLVARGEVVEINDEYGVRITEVVPGALD